MNLLIIWNCLLQLMTVSFSQLSQITGTCVFPFVSDYLYYRQVLGAEDTEAEQFGCCTDNHIAVVTE